MKPRQPLVLIAAALLVLGCDDPRRAEIVPAFQGGLPGLLDGDEGNGFARAKAVREFRFPRDHGPHPAYRNEWWYVTGNLESATGRRFGFQVTFFRLGLAPGRNDRPSRWATNQAWMAHFALTDARNGSFHAFERFSRGGDIGLAGARRAPVRVWLEDWQLRRLPNGRWRLAAEADGIALDLGLEAAKDPVLQGDRGLSIKSGESGNASFYYSLTRLEAEGRVSAADADFQVAGTAWLDREWGTSALGAEQVGWDWFALQLDDGTDVMIYRLRDRGGETSPWSAGSVVAPDGNATKLSSPDFHIEVLSRWTSPLGGTYPSRMRLTVEPLDATLTVIPVLPDQELNSSVRYWEGAVDVLRNGSRAGTGYMELTGYAELRHMEQSPVR